MIDFGAGDMDATVERQDPHGIFQSPVIRPSERAIAGRGGGFQREFEYVK